MSRKRASGPAQRARKTQAATGLKYTQIRARSAPRNGRVVQFLFERGWDADLLVDQFAGAWARQGMRVLLLHEYKSFPAGLGRDLRSRRAKERQAAEARRDAWPGPCSKVLWHAETGEGMVAAQHAPWHTRDLLTSVEEQAHAAPDPDDPLHEAVKLAQQHFDVVIVKGKGSWPQKQVSHHVVLAHGEGIPTEEGVPYSYDQDTQHPRHALSPQQSAALLRERHLKFLGHFPVLPLGMVLAIDRWAPRRRTAVPAAFRKDVEENMATVGPPLLGETLAPRSLQADLDMVKPAPFTAPVEGVQEAARAVHAAWSTQPARPVQHKSGIR